MESESQQMNIGDSERVIRFLVGFSFFIWGLVTDNYVGFLGFLLVFSGVFGYCPIYRALKVNRHAEKSKKYDKLAHQKSA